VEAISSTCSCRPKGSRGTLGYCRDNHSGLSRPVSDAAGEYDIGADSGARVIRRASALASPDQAHVSPPTLTRPLPPVKAAFAGEEQDPPIAVWTIEGDPPAHCNRPVEDNALTSSHPGSSPSRKGL